MGTWGGGCRGVGAGLWRPSETILLLGSIWREAVHKPGIAALPKPAAPWLHRLSEAQGAFSSLKQPGLAAAKAKTGSSITAEPMCRPWSLLQPFLHPHLCTGKAGVRSRTPVCLVLNLR